MKKKNIVIVFPGRESFNPFKRTKDLGRIYEDASDPFADAESKTV